MGGNGTYKVVYFSKWPVAVWNNCNQFSASFLFSRMKKQLDWSPVAVFFAVLNWILNHYCQLQLWGQLWRYYHGCQWQLTRCQRKCQLSLLWHQHLITHSRLHYFHLAMLQTITLMSGLHNRGQATHRHALHKSTVCCASNNHTSQICLWLISLPPPHPINLCPWWFLVHVLAFPRGHYQNVLQKHRGVWRRWYIPPCESIQEAQDYQPQLIHCHTLL